ncbi:MAG: hypothetical protein V3W41_17300 [Planctomycetota bacterium]
MPPQGTASKVPTRTEAKLPLAQRYADATLEEYLASPSEFPAFKKLLDFVSIHADRLREVDAVKIEMDAELFSLLQLLANKGELAKAKFVAEAIGIPQIARSAGRQPVVDSRDKVRDPLLNAVAFQYRQMWWSFWAKSPQLPPVEGPGLSSPFGRTAFNKLILFPRYQSELD